MADSKDILNEARENYLEIKRLLRIFEDLKESFKLQDSGVSQKGQMNFYQRDLLQKQGESEESVGIVDRQNSSRLKLC